MRSSTIYEEVHETPQGYKYIELRTGRRVTFYDAQRKAETSLSNLWRWMARMGKLARKYDGDLEEYDFDWKDIERMVGQIETLAAVWRKKLEKHSVKISKERKIKALRNTKGREPEEAAAYLEMANKLEAEL